MATGTLKMFNADRGFGFIATEDGSPDVFVHISALERGGIMDPRKGMRLTFDLVQDRKSGKMAADNVQEL